MATSDEVSLLDYGRGASARRRALWRVALLGVQGLLTAGGFFAFVCSLALPAWPGDAWHIRSYTGLACLIWGFPFWPSNALLLLSPVAVLVLSFTYIRPPYLVLAVFFLVSDGVVLYGTYHQIPYIRRFPGYGLWLCAHALVTAGVLLPTWIVHPRRNLPQRG